MTQGAPTDPLFYVDLDAMAQRNGLRAEDALFIWTSESGLDPALSGSSRTFSTLMHNVVVPGVMSEATWESLPTMSHREQLPWIEKAVWAGAHAGIGGRHFRSTFEVYLANAAPALLRPDGIYDDETPMYVGNNYPDNWTMERTGPTDAPSSAAVDGYNAWKAAQPRGANLSPRASYSVAQGLVAQGLIKGFVSLGDLREFARRISTQSPILATAILYLHNVRASVAAGEAPNIHGPLSGGLEWQPASLTEPAYSPDLDSQFAAPGTHVDTRVATPSKAHAVMPKSAAKAPAAAPGLSPVVKVGIVAGLGFAAASALAHGRKP